MQEPESNTTGSREVDKNSKRIKTRGYGSSLNMQ